MSQRRREVGRATVESDGHAYTLIVYQTTWDEWDDPEGRIEERYAVLGPDIEPQTTDEIENDWRGVRASGDFIGRTVHDGGGRDRAHLARLREAAHEREAEEAARRAKVTPETPRLERWRHPDCGHVGEREEYAVPAYECSRCSSVGLGEDGRRCETCHIFRAKVADFSCPACEAPLDTWGEGELEPIVGVEVDGHFLPDEPEGQAEPAPAPRRRQFHVAFTEAGVLSERIGRPFGTLERANARLDEILADRRSRLGHGWYLVLGPGARVERAVGIGVSKDRPLPELKRARS